MHISFTAHNSNSSTSSSSLIEYLDKENHLQNERGEGLTIENYFNSDYDSINSNQEINSQEIINNLDSNRGSQKLASSNFYMLNVSPSKFELEHMEKIAEAELKNRGLEENNNKASQLLYKEQKEELMKMQLKLYAKDVMTNYAQNFNREIYVNEDKLPNDAEKSVIMIGRNGQQTLLVNLHTEFGIRHQALYSVFDGIATGQFIGDYFRCIIKRKYQRNIGLLGKLSERKICPLLRNVELDNFSERIVFCPRRHRRAYRKGKNQ